MEDLLFWSTALLGAVLIGYFAVDLWRQVLALAVIVILGMSSQQMPDPTPSATPTPTEEAWEWPRPEYIRATVEAVIDWPAPDVPTPTPEAVAHLMEAPEPVPLTGYAAIASCGVPCWGERMTHAGVEALALRVTGDPVWSSWAAWCFSTPGGESGGYVGAVGGPNRNGTYDLGFGQSNTATLAGLGYDAGRVLVDVEYAMDALYATWLAQGYGAWFGCKGGE